MANPQIFQVVIKICCEKLGDGRESIAVIKNRFLMTEKIIIDNSNV